MFLLFKILDDANILPTKIVDLGIVDARYLKLYTAHHRNESHMGELLYKAHKSCFDSEGKGHSPATRLHRASSEKILQPIPSLGSTQQLMT